MGILYLRKWIPTGNISTSLYPDDTVGTTPRQVNSMTNPVSSAKVDKHESLLKFVRFNPPLSYKQTLVQTDTQYTSRY